MNSKTIRSSPEGYKSIISIIFSLSFFSINAQPKPSYLEDLSALHSILLKTPSYKAQIKGSSRKFYNDLYEDLKKDTITDIADYRYFYNLSQLFFPIRDNHLAFYQIPDYEHFKDKTTIDKYVLSKAFAAYPKYAINIDSLRSALAQKPINSVEGIYYYEKFYSVGVFQTIDKKYVGVIVDTDVSLWQIGQIAIHLYEEAPNHFKAIYGHPLTKNFILNTNEKFQNNSLMNSYFYSSYSDKVYSKTLNQIDFINLPKNTQDFNLRSIRPDIQYLLIKSFSANNFAMQKSDSFYSAIKDSLTAPNLILDLRNNVGGAKKVSKKYFNLIKQYSKKGKVYVLINNGTISRGEIFTLQLMKIKNVVTLGQTTKGMLSYGSNYGKRVKLPSQKFEVYITDMKGKGNHLDYENIGVNPDIYLSDKSDWIEQAMTFIKTSTNK